MGNTSVKLKRTLSLPAMVFYGLGTIVGAGIYVLIGKIAGLAGPWTPVAFVVAAVIAGFTGLSYAELVSRHPRSAGEAVYVQKAFNTVWLAQVVGWAVVLTGLVSASTLLKGYAGYFIYLIGGSEFSIITLTVIAVGGLVCIGVRQSVGVTVAMTLLEVAGLLLVVLVSADQMIEPERWEYWQKSLTIFNWQSVAAASFLAFYAFIGFEDMVNMAEEVKDVSVALPRAIFISLFLATVIYALVSIVAVVAFDPQALAQSPVPLATMTEKSTWLSPKILAGISLIAIVNGVIVQLLMVPRVIYGITSESRLLGPLGRIHPATQTPVNATLLTALLVWLFALSLPLTLLAKITSTIILLIFILINTALIILKITSSHSGFQAPIWAPVLGIVTSLLLLTAQLFTL
ncbi:MAG: APA family basic amino acid/polyamine antiporter [Cellvibrionaceae bacterium]|jgi:APA family basic amino acid/polyamine antiporter